MNDFHIYNCVSLQESITVCMCYICQAHKDLSFSFYLITNKALSLDCTHLSFLISRDMVLPMYKACASYNSCFSVKLDTGQSQVHIIEEQLVHWLCMI